MRLHSYPSFPVSLVSRKCWAILGFLVVELANLGLRVVVVEMTNLLLIPLHEHALNLTMKSSNKEKKKSNLSYAYLAINS